jgi:hypothetical protein
MAGRLGNELRDLAVTVRDLPTVAVSPDPFDTYLLAMAAAGAADILVTSDNRGLLALKIYRGTRIVTVRDCLALCRWRPRSPCDDVVGSVALDSAVPGSHSPDTSRSSDGPRRTTRTSREAAWTDPLPPIAMLVYIQRTAFNAGTGGNHGR